MTRKNRTRFSYKNLQHHYGVCPNKHTLHSSFPFKILYFLSERQKTSEYKDQEMPQPSANPLHLEE